MVLLLDAAGRAAADLASTPPLNQRPCVITRPFARWEGGCCLHLAEEMKDVSQLLVPLADYDQGEEDWSVAAEG